MEESDWCTIRCIPIDFWGGALQDRDHPFSINFVHIEAFEHVYSGADAVRAIVTKNCETYEGTGIGLTDW